MDNTLKEMLDNLEHHASYAELLDVDYIGDSAVRTKDIRNILDLVDTQAKLIGEGAEIIEKKKGALEGQMKSTLNYLDGQEPYVQGIKDMYQPQIDELDEWLEKAKKQEASDGR